MRLGDAIQTSNDLRLSSSASYACRVSKKPRKPVDVEQLKRGLDFTADLRGRSLRFHTTWGLFSPRGLDDGTKLLLDYFQANETDHTFDLGCGYGPIGLAMALDAPRGKVTMVDRDFLAVDYANRNAALNGLSHATARLGHGFEGVDPDERFDNVVSNLPAKTGAEMLTILLHDAHRHLKPGGRICVVVVTGLRRFIERHLEARFGNYDKLKQSPGYTVAVAVRQED